MAKRKIIKIIICLVILASLIGAGIGVYAYYNHGSIIGHVEVGEYYRLKEIRPSDRFKGATMSTSSYFRIKNDGKTGELYLVGLEASATPIPLIITNYKEGIKQTVIDFEYILDKGEDTTIQHLTAISTDTEITIKAVESYGVEVIHQKNGESDPDTLEYESTILVFSKEVA